MRRLFLPGAMPVEGYLRITDGQDISYLASVLRMKAGDELLVSDGVHSFYETRIAETQRKEIVLRVLSQNSLEAEPGPQITLYQGLPKGAKLDEIVRKATELGVHRIVPVRTVRSIPDLGEKGAPARLKRLCRIAEEAARQSRRMRVPEVASPLDFQTAADGLAHNDFDLLLVPYELEERVTLKQVLRTHSGAGKIALFIGPEGGFERTEIERLQEAGAISVSLGEAILRTETAGPAVLAMLRYELEL